MIFMAAIEVDLHCQESDQYVCYQEPYIIPPDDKDAEVPILFSDDRDKSNEEYLDNLVNMNPEKPPETKHVIDPNQELLAA